MYGSSEFLHLNNGSAWGIANTFAWAKKGAARCKEATLPSSFIVMCAQTGVFITVNLAPRKTLSYGLFNHP